MKKNPILYPAIVFNVPNGISYRLIHFGPTGTESSVCKFVPNNLGYAQIAYNFWSARMMTVTYMPISVDKTINEKFLGAFFELRNLPNSKYNTREYRFDRERDFSIYYRPTGDSWGRMITRHRRCV